MPAQRAADGVTTSTSWDNANNLTGYEGDTYGFDPLNRLTSATSAPGGYGSLSYSYDANGNMTGNTGTSFTYASGSDRWTGGSYGTNTIATSATATGNISTISINGGALLSGTYNAANRLSATTASGLAATLTYDAFGQRITKTNPSSPSTFFSYDQGSALLEEADNGGNADYIYLGGRLIGMVQNPGGTYGLYSVNTSYLGTVRMVSDGSGTTVFSSYISPYGIDVGTSGSVTQSLRLPGQYLDSGDGFFYNIHRDYYDLPGRYLQPDPIGLNGGLNPYAYVSGNPVSNTDRLGLVNLNLYPRWQRQSIWAQFYNPPGVYSVGAHGNMNYLSDQDSNQIDPIDLAMMITLDLSYKQGEPIVLLSCEAGLGENSFAQRLSELLNAPVVATPELEQSTESNTLWTEKFLGMTVGSSETTTIQFGTESGNPGIWNVFNPGANTGQLPGPTSVTFPSNSTPMRPPSTSPFGVH